MSLAFSEMVKHLDNMINEKQYFEEAIYNAGHRQYMHLKLFVPNEDNSQTDRVTKYSEHILRHNSKITLSAEQYDSGFDLYVPNDLQAFTKVLRSNQRQMKIDFGIKCSAQMVTLLSDPDSTTIDKSNQSNKYNTGYYMYGRSSISKTSLRLANNQGIIDSGYRGNLIGMFDMLSDYGENDEQSLHSGDRLIQICAPNLAPIYVELVNTFDELGSSTIRNSGGFGSTGRN